jgi:hypothetical protein
MKRFWNKIVNWNFEKNELLKKDRDISFSDILQSIEEWNFWKINRHPNKEKYPNQKILQIEINDYIHIIPFVENDEEIFLKTIFKDRKVNKMLKRD